MDGRGRCHDNIFVERLWWTVKHEWVYLRPAANGIEQKRSLGEFFGAAANADRACDLIRLQMCSDAATKAGSAGSGSSRVNVRTDGAD